MDAGEQRKGDKQRRHIRWAVEEHAVGRITAIYEASLINISLGGALIEHMHLVRPGTISFLTLWIHGQEVNLRCRVVRSVVLRSEVQADGEHELVYRTGLEFLDTPEDLLRQIDEYIESLKRQSPDAESEVLT